jgi:hypothetical protein
LTCICVLSIENKKQPSLQQLLGRNISYKGILQFLRSFRPKRAIPNHAQPGCGRLRAGRSCRSVR